jgi:hypothetical protein
MKFAGDRGRNFKISIAGQFTKSSIVSGPAKGAPKQPSKKVVSAFIRRGAKVLATQGKKACPRAPITRLARIGDATALPLSNQVEE